MRRRLAQLLAVGLLVLSAAPAHGAIAIRKDVKDMTAQEKKAFVDAVLKLKHTPSPFGKNHISLYDVFVYYHRRVSNLPVDGAHQGPAFLPWHREFLYAFEAALINVSGDKDLAIPYWDWTDPASTRAVFSRDFLGTDGNPRKHHAVVNGPFRKGKWKIVVPELVGSANPFEPQIDQVADHPYIQRALGWTSRLGVTGLPTAAEMARVMSVSQYDAKPWNRNTDPRFSFRCALEGWGKPGDLDTTGSHNQVHLWIGGAWEEQGGIQLGTTTGAASPNDPIFWLIHSNIERLWQQWQDRNGRVYEPVSGARFGHNLRDPLSQFAQLGLGITDADLADGKKLRPIDLLDPTPLQAVYQQPLR
ncbi:MAG: putative tyrosinase [Solirubrobacterales bacterium]|nr:putative tyrosinase [Solirubrobacterales bacterium]